MNLGRPVLVKNTCLALASLLRLSGNIQQFFFKIIIINCSSAQEWVFLYCSRVCSRIWIDMCSELIFQDCERKQWNWRCDFSFFNFPWPQHACMRSVRSAQSDLLINWVFTYFTMKLFHCVKVNVKTVNKKISVLPCVTALVVYMFFCLLPKLASK